MNHHVWTPTRLVAIAAIAAIGCQARADLKVASTVAISGGPSQAGTGRDGKSAIVTYYQGSKIRSEHTDGSKVTIFDGAQVYILDPKAKTYYILDSKATSQRTGNFTLKPDVKVTKTSETKTIAGKSSTKYAVTGEIKIESGGGGGGAVAGNGGRLGGGRLGGRGGRGGGGAGSMAFKFSGDLWATTEVKSDVKSILQVMTGASIPGGDALFQQINGSLNGAGLILAGSFKIDPPSIAASRMSSITIVIDSQNVEETTLDQGMFKVPDGYTKVDRPTRQGGGFGGQGFGGG